MRRGALFTLFMLATLCCGGCSDDEFTYTSESEFDTNDFDDMADDYIIPSGNSWTITDSDVYKSDGPDIATVIEWAYDEGRTIDLTFSEVTKIRSEFMQRVSGIGALNLPKVTEVQDLAFWGTVVSSLSLTTEEDFVSISETAFSGYSLADVTLYLNANKEGLEIENLTERGWGAIVYE